MPTATLPARPDTAVWGPEASPVLSAVVLDGLAPDEVVKGLGIRLAGLRLVFLPVAPTRCCAGHQPAFVAIGAEDAGLRALERVALSAVGPGRAVPGIDLPALAGGVLALPGLSLVIGPAQDLGPGLEHVVVFDLGDAARGLSRTDPAWAMTPRTVALVYGEGSAPPPWRAASQPGVTVSLGAGLGGAAVHRVTA